MEQQEDFIELFDHFEEKRGGVLVSKHTKNKSNEVNRSMLLLNSRGEDDIIDIFKEPLKAAIDLLKQVFEIILYNDKKIE